MATSYFRRAGTPCHEEHLSPCAAVWANKPPGQRRQWGGLARILIGYLEDRLPLRLADGDLQDALRELVYFGCERTQKLLGYRPGRIGYAASAKG